MSGGRNARPAQTPYKAARGAPRMRDVVYVAVQYAMLGAVIAGWSVGMEWLIAKDQPR